MVSLEVDDPIQSDVVIRESRVQDTEALANLKHLNRGSVGSGTACQSPPEQTHVQITLTGPSQDWTLRRSRSLRGALGKRGSSGAEPGPACAASAPSRQPRALQRSWQLPAFPEADGQSLPQRGCVALVLRFPWQTQAPYVSNYSWCSFLPGVSAARLGHSGLLRPLPTECPHVAPFSQSAELGPGRLVQQPEGFCFLSPKLFYFNRVIN